MNLIRMLRYCNKRFRKDGEYYDKKLIQECLDLAELAYMDLL